MSENPHDAAEAANCPRGLPRGVFDDLNVFRQTMEMATALSRSFFVPKTFQGSPESCLIALDLSRRLGVHVMTLLPHIYIIDQKPSFSTQFLISLVNTSGRFSRLEWDEGTDGTTEVTYSDWGDQRGSKNTWTETVPNRFAVARFTELATGKKFESPRVDMAFAEKNGWTSKPGSKWRSMPEIMCAYRSASILIKRVCPEITMGLEFAEDVRDAVDVEFKAPQQTTPQTPASVVAIEQTNEQADETDLVATFLAQIANAKTLDELNNVAEDVRNAREWSKEERARLAGPWRDKQLELKAQADDDEEDDELEEDDEGEVEEATEPTQPAPAPSPLQVVQELTNAIAQAQDADALGAAIEALEVATCKGRLPGDAFAKLSKMAEDRQVALEMEAQESKEEEPKAKKRRPSKATQTRYVDGLVQALAESNDSGAVENLIETAKGYVANGMISEEQSDVFRAKATEKLKTFLV